MVRCVTPRRILAQAFSPVSGRVSLSTLFRCWPPLCSVTVGGEASLVPHWPRLLWRQASKPDAATLLLSTSFSQRTVTKFI